MATETSCPYCGEPYLNFGDDDEVVEMWIDGFKSGSFAIAVDPPYAWSIPINYCPFCGGEVFAREVIIIGGTEEFEIRHRDEDAAYRDSCPMVVGLYPDEGELVAAWNYSK